LRKRVQDIPLLVPHFIEMYKKKSKKLVFGIADDAMSLLKNYNWPGNIRELENVIERAVITCSKRVITVEDLPPNIVEYARAEENNLIVLEVGSSLQDAERYLIKETMRYTGGDKKRAAQILGITRKTLYRKLGEYGLG
jgi:two-component system response regulator HydG